MSWKALRKEWNERMTDVERLALERTSFRESPATQPERSEGAAVDFAIDHCYTRNAVVSERRLHTEALKRGIGSVTVEGVQRELDRRDLVRGEQGGQSMVTTKEMVAMESRLIDFARKGRGRFRPLGDAERKFHREWLNDGQKAAVRDILGSRDRVMIIRGVQGTGKTTMEQELGEALAEAGRHVVALAPTADASRGVLREKAGFSDADTVARFFTDEAMQQSARKGVVLVDEASLLGTRDMVRLFEIVERVEARVILVGDRHQHRSVAAGEPLKLLEERAGLPVAQVTEIMRQSGDYRKAATALSEGRVEDGFLELDKLGWIKEVGDADRYKELAAAYLGAIEEKNRKGENKSALVISPTHAEIARITRSIRDVLKSQGKLGDEHNLPVWIPAQLTDPQKKDAAYYDLGDMLEFHQNAPGHKKGSRLIVAEGMKLPLAYADRFEVYRPGQIGVAKHDRIRLTAGGKTKDGHSIRNGSLYSVKSFTRRGDLVLDNGWVLAKEWGHVSLGYAVTSHKSQGRSLDKVFIGESSQSFAAANRRQFYVSMTRASEQAVVFTDNKVELLKAVRRPDEPMSATALVGATKRKPPLRHRLQRHLRSMRRLAGFSQLHEGRENESQKDLTWRREKHHAR